MSQSAAIIEEQESLLETKVFTDRFHRVRRGHGKVFVDAPAQPPSPPVRRPARVAQMLALAHRLQLMIDTREFESQGDLARHFGLTPARITQLLDLILLAPDIQEEILFLEAVDGIEPVSERGLRMVLATKAWEEQMAMWKGIGVNSY